MSWWQRFFRWVGFRASGSILPSAVLGINTHLADPADVSALAQLRSTTLRTTDYGDAASTNRITILESLNTEILVVMTTEIPPITGAKITWQYHNEPDITPVAPEQYSLW